MNKPAPKVQVKSDRIKTLRLEQGLSIAALEDLITALHDTGRCRRKIGKSVLHRIETSDGKSIPFWQIQIIGLALEVEPDSLTENNAPVLQKIRTLNLFKVATGDALSSMVQKVSQYRFRLEEEPGTLEAQAAVINLLKLLEDRYTRRNLIEKTQYNFELRQVIEMLNTHGLAIFTEASKQVAPYTVGDTTDGSFDVYYELINSPLSLENDYWAHFDGMGLCDVLLISIDKNTDPFYETKHDMDPANLLTDDSEEAFLIENVKRVCDGEDELTLSEFRELESVEFVSDRARIIELRSREIRKKKKDDEM